MDMKNKLGKLMINLWLLGYLLWCGFILVTCYLWKQKKKLLCILLVALVAYMVYQAIPHVNLKEEPKPTLPQKVQQVQEVPKPRVKELVYNVPLSEDEKALVRNLLVKYNMKVNEASIHGLMYTESRFDKDAVSEAGAIGIMQVLPSTFNYAYAKMVKEFPELSHIPNSIHDPKANIVVGMYYLHYLAVSFGYETVTPENFSQILTAYNRGIGGASRYYNRNGHYNTAYARSVQSYTPEVREVWK